MADAGYGQFCPVAKAAEVVAERWTPLVLRELLAGSSRFNELRRGVPLMSPSLLSDRLDKLRRAGVLERHRVGGSRHWSYRLTEAGEQLRPLIGQMAAWGQRWTRGAITRADLDPTYTMWAMLRRVEQRGIRPSRRVVMLFQLRDAQVAKRYWWLVLDLASVDLCLTDPGFDIDVSVHSDLQTMMLLLLDELALGRARSSRKLLLEGPARLTRQVPGWLGFTATGKSTAP